MVTAVTDSQRLPADESLLEVLRMRDREASEVVLRDGKKLTVFNIAWGYDMGDEFAHVTSNISPEVDNADIDFFFTNQVVRIVDPENGAILFDLS